MADQSMENSFELSEDQIEILHELGVSESEISELNYEDAEELIAELRAMRTDDGCFGNY